MKGTIRVIGRADSKSKSARVKTIRSSPVDDVLGRKFLDWNSPPAKDWVYARVKEYLEGREIELRCDCCQTKDPSEAAKHRFGRKLYEVKHCYVDELVELIINLASMEKDLLSNTLEN